MRKITTSLLYIFLLCAALLLSGCGEAAENGSPSQANTEQRASTTQNQKKHSTSFFAMDTFMELSVYGEDATPEAARDIITEIERAVSTTSPSSDIYRLNHRESGAAASGVTEKLLSDALGLCALTDGAFDISIYPVVRAWGFTTGEHRIPTEAELSALLEKVDYRKIQVSEGAVSLPEGMEIDLGGVAKGYAGAQAAAYLRERGVTSALLSLGGNVQTVGAKPDGSPWRVAVQDPAGGGSQTDGGSQTGGSQTDGGLSSGGGMSNSGGLSGGGLFSGFAGVVEIVDKAAVTSGGYQRYFVGEDGETYWHIMDPSTGRPAKNGLVSVTIVARDGALCDALSTALFVMGPERAVSFWRERRGGAAAFGMVLITDDGRLLVTPDLSFTADPSAPYRVEVLAE